MNKSLSIARDASIYSYHEVADAPREPTITRRTDAPTFPRRTYEIMHLDSAGQLQDVNIRARALPAFEAAFCVLKQGALVKSEHGYVSVEDVFPGDKLQLGNGEYETVEWRGSIAINPEDEAANAQTAQLTRITADAMGLNRPSPDLVLGHGARLLHRAPGIRRVSGSDAAFIPAADFDDGNTVIPLRPATPVNMYQFGFAKQRSLMVNGLEIETLHPGTAFNLGLRGESLRAYLQLFPHKSSFEDFGLLETPRLRLRDLDLLS